MILTLEKLIKINIHKLIKADGWSATIRGKPDYELTLKPIAQGNEYFLELYANGQKCPWRHQLSSYEIIGRLGNGGSVKGGSERWYVVGNNSKRYKHLYISPDVETTNFKIGTRAEIKGQYKCNLLSKKRRKAAKSYIEAMREIRPDPKRRRLRIADIELP